MINIDFYDTAIEESSLEIVERKGIGHPDTICDGVVDRIAVEIANLYKKSFGRILHFNIDKALLSAGMVEKGFGSGKVIKPMELYIGDRATFISGGHEIDINTTVLVAAKSWLSENLPHLNIDSDIVIKSLLSKGSEELTTIFSKRKSTYLANDTSAAVGYYPLSLTEQTVLGLERYLNSEMFKKTNPDTGQDIKVMALRLSRNLDITIAMPLLAEKIKSEKQYFLRKKELEDVINKFVMQFRHFENVQIKLNALDRKKQGLNGVYLTLLGTSAEDADSGEVGRGNKVNGVIAVTRPIGTEAAAGKNPISHVGKIYNLFAHYLAKKIFLKTEGLKEVYVFLLSEIGKPINKPKTIYVRLACKNGASKTYINKTVKDIIEEEFSKINGFCEDLSVGKYSVY